MKYCRWNEDKTEYIAIDPRLKDAGSIITIGFERDTAYLANALEVFLSLKSNLSTMWLKLVCNFA